MYVIIVYDVEASKCSKVMKVLRKYLFHVQNSTFEGEITNGQFLKMKGEINKIIDERDKIIYYLLSTKKVLKKESNYEKDNNLII